MLSTTYILFAPLVIYKLILRRLTLIDLTLDRYIADQYRLTKCLYLMVTDDFSLAAREPQLEYEPDDPAWREKLKEAPARYWRQGIYLGIVDNLVDSLITEEPGRPVRCKTFGEFASEYRQETSPLAGAF